MEKKNLLHHPGQTWRTAGENIPKTFSTVTLGNAVTEPFGPKTAKDGVFTKHASHVQTDCNPI